MNCDLHIPRQMNALFTCSQAHVKQRKPNEDLYQDLLPDFKIYYSLDLSCKGSDGNSILSAIKTP